MFYSLKKNEEFKKVFGNAKSYVNKYLVVYIIKNNYSYNRIGISVSKKIGNSVVRHRVKRVIKECYIKNQSNVNNGFDIVIIPRVSILELKFDLVEVNLKHLLNLHGLMHK